MAGFKGCSLFWLAFFVLLVAVDCQFRPPRSVASRPGLRPLTGRRQARPPPSNFRRPPHPPSNFRRPPHPSSNSRSPPVARPLPQTIRQVWERPSTVHRPAGHRRNNVLRPRQHRRPRPGHPRRRPSVAPPTLPRPNDVTKKPRTDDVTMMKHKTQQRKQIASGGPQSSTGDLFGRSKVHPSRIPRFQKFFQPLNDLSAHNPRGSAANSGHAHGHGHSHDHDDLILNHFDHSHKSEASINDHADIMRGMGPAPHRPIVPPTDLSRCQALPNLDIDGSDFFVSSGAPDAALTCPPMTWSEASDFCQSSLMSIVSLGKSVDPITAQEILNITNKFDNMEGFWTGGYVTHPDNSRVSNSVVWSSISRETELVSPGQGHFSPTGETGQAQPDNWAFVASGGQDPYLREHCLAVLNNKYGDGSKLHDLSCSIKLPVVCQALKIDAMDSSMMML